MALPHFAFYPFDWLGDIKVQQLTLEETGAYINLLAYMWCHGHDCMLPLDDRMLARVLHLTDVRWKEMREVLIDGQSAVFTILDGNKFTNKRLFEEYQKAISKVNASSEAGKKSGETRKKKKRSTSVQRVLNGRSTDVEPLDKDLDKEKILKDAATTNAYAREELLGDQVPAPDEVPILEQSINREEIGLPLPNDLPTVSHEEFLQIEQLAMRLMQRQMIYPDEFQMLKDLTASGVPIPTIVRGIQESFATYKPKNSRDKISRLTYCENHIWDLHEKLTYIPKVNEGGNNGATHRQQSPRDTSADSAPTGKFGHLRTIGSNYLPTDTG